MRVAVIGAGLSGLVCASDLLAAGHDVVVFEKSRGLGGRIASRRVDETVVDHGMPVFWSSGPLRDVADALPEAPTEISLPVGDASGDRDRGGRPWAYPEGLTRLAKQMASDIDVRRSVRIATIRLLESEIEVGDEQGNGQGSFDRLVVSAPAPQSADLLDGVDGESARVRRLRSLVYAPGIVVLVGLRLPAHPPWFGTRDGGPGPLDWVGIESAKGRPVTDGAVPVVAHLSDDLSASLFDAPDAEVLRHAVPALQDLLGSGAAEPAWSQVKRWRYAAARSRLSYDEMNPPGSRIVICGDSVAATPDLDAVVETGRAAARQVSADR